MRNFYYNSTLAEKVRILDRYGADYLMVPAESPLNETLGSQPGFEAVYTSAGRYSLYAANRGEVPDR